MSEGMNVFISYKMPKGDDGPNEKFDIAQEFARELTDASGGRIKLHFAGNFPAGVDWRGEIIKTITECDMFILLYTGADQQWEFGLLEAGLFHATHPTRQLVVLHDPSTPRPSALAQLNSVGVDPEGIKKFLRPIFYDDPWKIFPNKPSDKFDALATDLVRIFHSVGSSGTNFDLVPSFTLDMGASDHTRTQLQCGKIPENTIVRGTQDWQSLFDKGSVIQSLKWGELDSWSVKSLYDLRFSRMALQALNKDTPGGCFLRPSIPSQSGVLYRVALRRYEEYANQAGWRFFFTAAPIDIPIFGIDDVADGEETREYHLLNVCWYTRRRLILNLCNKIEDLAIDANASAYEKNVAISDVKDEIVSINIQSFIRKIDHPRALGHLLSLSELQADQKLWKANTDQIFSYRNNSNDDFEKVREALQSIRIMNDKYYAISAAAFAASVARREPTRFGLSGNTTIGPLTP